MPAKCTFVGAAENPVPPVIWVRDRQNPQRVGIII
jgi:hypothetical protein